jgi:hypothetical protein
MEVLSIKNREELQRVLNTTNNSVEALKAELNGVKVRLEEE